MTSFGGEKVAVHLFRMSEADPRSTRNCSISISIQTTLEHTPLPYSDCHPRYWSTIGAHTYLGSRGQTPRGGRRSTRLLCGHQLCSLLKLKMFNTQTLHVYHICPHWGGLEGQCRHIFHTWSVWDIWRVSSLLFLSLTTPTGVLIP